MVGPPITFDTKRSTEPLCCDSSLDSGGSSNPTLHHDDEVASEKNRNGPSVHTPPTLVSHSDTNAEALSDEDDYTVPTKPTPLDDSTVVIRDAATPSPTPTGGNRNTANDDHHHHHHQIGGVFDCSDDESGNIMERDYTGMFEGPEKTLEVVFRRVVDNSMIHSHSDSHIIGTGTTSNDDHLAVYDPATTNGPQLGLRQLSRKDIDKICDRARCTILSSISNQYLDAYVLSESSLFIYPYMLVLKTCGTTTLLRCIATLIDLGRKLGLEIDWVGYSRKNFNFPGDQAFPHQSFHQELDYLYSHRVLSERLDGNGYTLGPVNGDHWFVFVADHTSRTGALEIDTDRVLNIMMFDIDENVAKFFHYDEYERNLDGETKDDEVLRISNEQTVESGIKDLCPGAIIDPRAFEPCGYSMNAVLFRSYTTIHITPESGSSYASFETNQKVGSYKALISNVIRTFRPKRFVMTLMADEGGLKQVKDNPLADAAIDSKIVVPATKAPESGSALRLASFTKQSFTYKRSSLASIKVEEDCCCMMGNWVLEKSITNSSNGGVNLLNFENRRGSKARGMTIS